MAEHIPKIIWQKYLSQIWNFFTLLLHTFPHISKHHLPISTSFTHVQSHMAAAHQSVIGIFQRFCSFRCFEVYSCGDGHKCDLLKKFEHFITSSLSVALIWMFLQSNNSNAWVNNLFCTNGMQMNVLMSVADKLLMVNAQISWAGQTCVYLHSCKL